MNRARRHAKRVLAELRKADVRAHAVVVDDAESRIASAFEVSNRRRSPLHFAHGSSQELFAIVARRAPCLVSADTAPALQLVASLPQLRPAREWAPQKKGRASRFQSLCEHLFASCPVPSVLWRGFFDEDRDALAPLIVWVASGGSLFQFAKARFAVPLTRKMCHLALASSSASLMRAIRRAEVLALEGKDWLANAWAASVHAARIAPRDDETFFVELLQWLARRAVSRDDATTLLDYAVARHREDPAFAMKGRSVAALLRDAHAWHRELAARQNVRHATFPASGYAPLLLRQTEPERVVWRVDEIRSTTDLFHEGRRMGHCVFSYAHAAASGATSIWSMTLEDGKGPTGRWAMLTIEVRNATRAVVQARGRFNRLPTRREVTILARWASVNGLRLST
ncbi:MAG TPA: PcfJ domain-containing protein [Polyangiaceae bacterium]|jgi:hypothetical protein